MTISGKKPKKNVNHGVNEKSGVESYLSTFKCKWLSREMTISGKKPKKNVNHGVNEKSGVEPPPSPTTPTSYRQLICNLRRVHPCGKTKSLLRTHAYCKTHAYYDMSYHNVELVSNYKSTVYKRRVWWGTVADRPPISRSFHGWHFSLVSCLIWSFLMTSKVR